VIVDTHVHVIAGIRSAIRGTPTPLPNWLQHLSAETVSIERAIVANAILGQQLPAGG